MTFALRPLLPWFDRSGRFSALRAVVFAAVTGPALWLVLRWFVDDLGPRPIVEAVHVSGDWAARLLIASIVVTPLVRLSGQSRLIGVRRMIGLAALAWAGLHFGLHALDLDFDLARLALEIALRPYLTIGFVAFLGLVALGVTSTDGMIRRLGGPAWKRLHGLVHPIVLLALVHVFLQSRLDLSQGAILTGVAGAGLVVRVAVAQRRRLGWGLVCAAIAFAFLAAAGAEALWFALKTGRAVWPLVATHFDFEVRVAPGWVAALIAFVFGSVSLWMRRRHVAPSSKTTIP